MCGVFQLLSGEKWWYTLWNLSVTKAERVDKPLKTLSLIFVSLWLIFLKIIWPRSDSSYFATTPVTITSCLGQYRSGGEFTEQKKKTNIQNPPPKKQCNMWVRWSLSGKMFTCSWSGTALWRCQSHPQPNTSWGGFSLDFKQKTVSLRSYTPTWDTHIFMIWHPLFHFDW